MKGQVVATGGSWLQRQPVGTADFPAGLTRPDCGSSEDERRLNSPKSRPRVTGSFPAGGVRGRDPSAPERPMLRCAAPTRHPAVRMTIVAAALALIAPAKGAAHRGIAAAATEDQVAESAPWPWNGHRSHPRPPRRTRRGLRGQFGLTGRGKSRAHDDDGAGLWGGSGREHLCELPRPRYRVPGACVPTASPGPTPSPTATS